MKKLSSVTISGGLTVDQATTLSGVVSVGGIGTGAYTSVLVRNSSNQMLYRTFSDFLNDISGSLNLSGYVPTSRTLTINGTTYDLSADRTWTITTPFVSKLQHTVKAGVAINKGQAVYVTGADGTNMIVGLASNASEATSSKTMGLLDATVSTNGFANVVTEGLLAGLDTSTAGAAGDPVWLGTGGNLIYGLGSKPYAPAHLVFIGIVTRKNANNGEIFVKVQNGFELREIHDVDLITSAPTAGQLLRYESDGLWKNWSPNYLTAEADTLATVTGRGATTNTSITVGPDLTVQADGSVNYTASRLWLNSHNNYRGAGVHMSGTGSTWFAGTPYTDFDGGYVIARTGTSNDVSSAQYSNALLTVKSSGNVGIGTTSPGSKLSVFGNNDVFSVISQTGDTSFATRLLAQYVGLFNNGANGHHLYVSSTQELGPAEFNLTKTWGGFLTFGTSSDGTARTRALYVNSNGYVGVNVNPISGDRFEVAGSVRIHTGNNWDAIQIYSDGANGYIQGLGDETGLRIRSEYGNILLADNRGNVGIGTSSPQSKLHIETSSSNPFRMVRGSTNFGFEIGGGAIGLYDYEDSIYRWYVDSIGNVGIGTTSPNAKLHVEGSSSDGVPVFRMNGTTAPNAFNYAGSLMNSSLGSSRNTILLIGKAESNRDSGYIGFNHSGTNSSNSNFLTFGLFQNDNILNITGAGNVGIGTTSPSYKLDVSGNSRTTGIHYVDTYLVTPYIYGGGPITMGNDVIIDSASAWNASAAMLNVGGTGDGRIQVRHIYGKSAESAAADHLWLQYQNTGNHVQIGAGSEGNNLYVSGNIYMNGYFGGNLVATQSWVNSQGFLTSVSDIWVNTTGDTMTGTLTIQGGWASTILDGDNVVLRKPNYSAGGWARTLLNFQEYDGTSLFQIGGYGSNNTMSYGYLGSAYNTPTFRWYADKTVMFDGSVGIGTTGPEAKLHIVSGSGQAGFLSRGTNGDTWFPYSNGQNYVRGVTNFDLGSVYFTGGNIGIGTTSPSHKLHIKSSSLNSYPLVVQRAANTNNIFYIYEDGSGNGTLTLENSGGGAAVSIKSDGTSYLNGGNVGIGTTSPQVKLDVNGYVGIVGSNYIYFGHTTTNIGAWTTRTYASGSTHYFNAQTFIFNNDGYGSYQHMALTANGVNLRGKNTIDSTDSWLRLNQSGDYGSGVYTPGLMRADGGFQVSGSTVWHAGNDGSGSGLDADLLDGNHASAFLSSSGDSEQEVGLRYASWNDGVRRMNTDPRWNESGYDADLGCLHIWSWTAAGVAYGRAGIALFSGSAYQYLTTKAGQTGIFVNNQEIIHSGNIGSQSVSYATTAGSLTSMNISQFTNNSSYATTSYVTTQINNLIAGAPGALDTLDELAAALGDDSNFATTVTNSIATKLPLAGGTMSGTISFINNLGTALQGTIGDNDFWRIHANSTSSNAGYLEIATSDDGTEPIYVRQYTGVFSSLTRTATLLDGAGNTAFPGNLNIGGFLTEASSLKLKENIETSEGNLEKVVNLRPVTYNKIGSQTTELGLIAEEVAEVYPEFVQYDENGEPIGVNYSRLTAALIGAVKELTNQVQELNKKING